MPEERTEPDAATRNEERREAGKEHRPDRSPTLAEEEAADEEAGSATGSVAAHEQEMRRIGAQTEGEGRA
jgi:hypothetical protein